MARRNRLVLGVSVVVSVVAVAAWFPASDLLHERQQLAAASTQLHHIHQQNQTLRREAKDLQTPAAVGRIAEQQYGLVPSGEQAYQVVGPGTVGGNNLTAATPTTAAGSGHAGAVGSGHPGASGPTGASGRAGATSGGFVERVLHTLEFWR